MFQDHCTIPPTHPDCPLRTLTVRLFWEKVNIASEDECWLWNAAKYKNGYGIFNTDNKPTTAHRYCYIIVHGSIPDGLFILHKCDVPACVNPNHLWAGTPLDNMIDRIQKGRANMPKGETHWMVKDPELARRVLSQRDNSKISERLKQYYKDHPEKIKFGSARSVAKLNEDQVRVIRRMAGCGLRAENVAKDFGVSRRTISGIWSGEFWKQVKE